MKIKIWVYVCYYGDDQADIVCSPTLERALELRDIDVEADMNASHVTEIVLDIKDYKIVLDEDEG